MTPQQIQPQLEAHVAALETELAEMKQLMSNFHQLEMSSPWWMEVASSFEHDSKFDEAVRFGQEWRKSAEYSNPKSVLESVCYWKRL
jgi:hypothetical protein